MANGVRITYGADSQEFEQLIGQPISNAVIAARQILNVPSDVPATLNGNSILIGATNPVVAGDEIVFMKASGSKGY